jgi:hypothetical protein
MRTVFCVLMLTHIAASPAFGDLISRHDPAIFCEYPFRLQGDGNLTYDSATNLEWLDLTCTLNLSYYSAANRLQDMPGFRYATSSEVAEFITNAGVTFPNNQQLDDSEALSALQKKWGITQEAPWAFTSNIITGELLTNSWVQAVMLSNTFDPEGMPDLALTSAFWASGSVIPSGSALVREVAIPEPSSIALASLGIVGLLAHQFRRRKVRQGNAV